MRWDQRRGIDPNITTPAAMNLLQNSIKWDIIDHWRAQGRRLTSPVAVDDQILLTYLDQHKDPEHEILALLSRIDAERRVPTLLALLDERQRQAIVAYYICGATQEEAAAKLGIGVRALQARLRKALDTLRRHLTEAEDVSETTDYQTREVSR